MTAFTHQVLKLYLYGKFKGKKPIDTRRHRVEDTAGSIRRSPRLLFRLRGVDWKAGRVTYQLGLRIDGERGGVKRDIVCVYLSVCARTRLCVC